MQPNLINPTAIFIAALSSFLVGGLWYSPLLFGRLWMRVNNLTEAEVQGGNKARIFGLSFLFTLVMAANLACFLAAPGTTILWGAVAGGLAGLWVCMAFGIVGLFERRSWAWILINAGQQVLTLILMGAILGAWR
jgi:hypothetical protein